MSQETSWTSWIVLNDDFRLSTDYQIYTIVSADGEPWKKFRMQTSVGVFSISVLYRKLFAPSSFQRCSYLCLCRGVAWGKWDSYCVRDIEKGLIDDINP